ncbi:MAG: MYXO-CTERM sorting domain-containing protein [Deltaproteobacteria bacterium]
MNSSTRSALRLSTSAATALGVLALAGAAHAVTETYTFRDTLAPREGGSSLVPVYNGGPSPAILTEGSTGFVPGSFVTEMISVGACASQPTVRAWSFPARGGFRHPNMAPVVASGSYTISMLVRFHPLTGGYARLIDFSDSTLDTGIYVLGGGVSFYPVGTFAAGSFSDGLDTFVTLTRDATTSLVILYINGLPSGTYTDTTNLYAPATGALYFFMDNTTGSAPIGEANAGVVAFLQISDAPISSTQVVASLGEICVTVRCGDGVLSPGEGCDSGTATGTATCDAMCRIRSGNACNATAPGAVGDASCASRTCVTAGVPAPGRCAECTGDAQCNAAAPACNPTTNLCVACTASNASHCAGATPGCNVVTNACVGCGAASVDPCVAGQMCDSASGRCVDVPDSGAADAGVDAEAGTGVDASAGADAAVDAGVDAQPGADADAGTVADVSEDVRGDVTIDARDGATSPDAGGEPAGRSAGCGCRTQAPRGGGVGGLALLALAAVVRRRRRR